MKTFIKKVSILLFLTIFLILVFRYNNIVALSSINALKLWITKLFPSLFIMFIINDLIINTNSLNFLNKLLSQLFKRVFHLGGESSLALILSISSGSPANGFILKELLNNNKISLRDANKLLMFTFFSNPLFLYNILSETFEYNSVIKIIFITYISNFFIAFLVKDKFINYIEQPHSDSKNIFEILESSIKKSINTMLMILGTISFFMITTNLLINILNTNDSTNILIKGILEITQALNDLPNLQKSYIIKEIIAITIISFGGLSIHMQIFSIISDTKMKYSYFLKGRLLHVITSLIITIISYIISSIIS